MASNPEKSREMTDGLVGENQQPFISTPMNPREKKLTILAFIFSLLVLSLLSAIIITIVIGILIPKRETCLDEYCLIKGVSIVKTMNSSVDPCHDFYQFACGGWMEEYDVDDDAETAILGKLQNRIYKKLDKLLIDNEVKRKAPEASQKAISAYRVCRKLQKVTTGANDIASLIAEFGGSILTGNYDADMSMGDRVATLLRFYGIGALLRVTVEPNSTNTEENILTISLPSLPTATGDIKKDLEIMQKVFSKNEEDFETFKEDYNFIKEKIGGIINTGKTIRKNDVDLGNTVDNEKTGPSVKVDDLNTLLSVKINWIDYFKILLKETKADETTPTENDIKELNVIVRNASVIKEIIGHFDKDGRLANFLAVNFVMGQPLLLFSYLNTLAKQELQSSEMNEESVCLQVVGQFLNYAIDYVYVDKETNSLFKTSRNAHDLISHIKSSFKNLIPKYDWLEEKTKKVIQEKLDDLNYFLGFPNWIKDKNKLNKFYEKLAFPSEEKGKLVESYANVVKFGLTQMWKQLYVKNRRDVWPNIPGFSVTTVNAFYVPHLNVFVLPLSIQRPPIYDERNPHYLTFGSLGMVIGHEITHGFDINGLRYGKTGNAKEELDEESKAEFEKRTKCLITQYSSYYVTNNTKINGEKTLGENMADGGGLHHAYYAYKDWLTSHGINYEKKLPLLQSYTPDQLFFISFGQTWCESAGKNYLKSQTTEDVHSPNKYRVIGTLSNSEEFIRAFKCPAGSKMNRPEKCRIW